MKRIKDAWRKWKIRTFVWEYWPMWASMPPVLFFFLRNAVRARKLLFFTNVNPGIATSGMFGESKIDILRQFPDYLYPTTLFFEVGTPLSQIKEAVIAAGITFPLIMKPNTGERGLLVKKIQDWAAFDTYVANQPIDFLVQSFIDWPEEAAIMYYRLPKVAHGKVTSICVKEPLTVTGNGKDTIAELMEVSDRAWLQLPRFRKEGFPLNEILAKGEKRLLEPIGNHAKGTAFLNGAAQMDIPRLTAFLDGFMKDIPTILYGRFDLKFKDPASLSSGEHFMMLEFNGVASDPAHVYDSSIPFLQKYKIYSDHWRIIYDIHVAQAALGVPCTPWAIFKKQWKDYQNLMAKVE